MVWDRGWRGEHEERRALWGGAHDAHRIVCLVAVPEQFHTCRGPSSVLHDKLVTRPALAQITRRQPGPAGEAPHVLQRNDQLPLRPAPHARLHVNNWLCPDVPVLPGGAVHMRPHQASVPRGYVLQG
jgi:hypothetical protein